MTPYICRKEKLSTEDGCVIWDSQVVGGSTTRPTQGGGRSSSNSSRNLSYEEPGPFLCVATWICELGNVHPVRTAGRCHQRFYYMRGSG